MKDWIYLIASAGLTLSGVAHSSVAQDEGAHAAHERGVTLDAQTRARVGITTVAAKSVRYRAEARGLGQVMGVDPLAQTDAELTIAAAAARASKTALARARGLFNADTSVSQQALESAAHQAAVDSAQLALAELRSTATWGRDAPWHDPKRRTALLEKIAAGRAAVVRATFPADSIGDSAPGSIRVERLGAAEGGQNWSATAVWSAPADPAVPGRSYYLLVDGAQGLAAGERVRVFAPFGPSEQGALVPAGAIIIAEGRTWLYVEAKADYFVRQAVDLSQPVAQGYVTSVGVQPGEAVVVEGAGQLLARETGLQD